MPLRAHLPGFRWFEGLQNSAFRAGLYTGVCMSLVLTGWLFLANRVPFIERFALERNLAAAGLLSALALIPVLRFLRYPGRLLLSGLAAWAVFSFVYRLLCLFFSSLGDRMGAFHVFVLGAIAYTIAATIAWVCALIWNVRRHHEPHSGHHLS